MFGADLRSVDLGQKVTTGTRLRDMRLGQVMHAARH